MSGDYREWLEESILHHSEQLLKHMNCAEYTHDNGVVSVRVVRSGVETPAETTRFQLDVYTLAEIIRRVDGNHTLGSAELAEAILREVGVNA